MPENIPSIQPLEEDALKGLHTSRCSSYPGPASEGVPWHMSPYIHVIFHASSARGRRGHNLRSPLKSLLGEKKKISHCMSNELSFLKRHKLLPAPVTSQNGLLVVVKTELTAAGEHGLTADCYGLGHLTAPL
ncbi:rCG23637, isoform CRA_b [Rattus norvegicus]|uniref:RCG23637, isoform CRA_b n=1 Tax=Rattus norvegicus TaxID=10116 RepID=A6KJS5_RAT|nr:rCG23637, isoform CRA_b [Rattus norvegicus]